MPTAGELGRAEVHLETGSHSEVWGFNKQYQRSAPDKTCLRLPLAGLRGRGVTHHTVVLGPRLGHIPSPLKLFGEDEEGAKLLLVILAPKSFDKLFYNVFGLKFFMAL